VPFLTSRDDDGAEADLTPKASPELATLRIDSDVPGAQVFIDRQLRGGLHLRCDWDLMCSSPAVE
jgi:hypothetical protein